MGKKESEEKKGGGERREKVESSEYSTKRERNSTSRDSRVFF